uniref:hypothetical protein n=1 Tax=Vibrio nigripulchritudo TaxID=28173 RepID=UPI0015E841B2|nr:hypothetical protein [Vibrio nigripulchritudo]
MFGTNQAVKGTFVPCPLLRFESFCFTQKHFVTFVCETVPIETRKHAASAFDSSSEIGGVYRQRRVS